ncbi:2-dehydropantoate 2-reductase [Robertmurraya kyonggiensis]|uniref:2-dehydropantoate 2-reductase n=1 Tax=Robertmurraya kyonggiensis TaxID=1037680 RepID=A0A4U1D7N2_9BACI|nr:2-dehydropantoate 2-reductase [Robertmurraya kyonggiensis]TKC18562.1 2-dehydropantoate 2-reductase [Robertmurraya kyonggiensis]
MKIAVIGGGSIGLLFSYCLHKHHEVTLYVRNPLQRERIASEGVVLQSKQKTRKADVQVRLISEWGNQDEELSIICVKQYQLEGLLRNASLPTNHPYLFLQNGMAHLKWVDRFNLTVVMVGTVEHGAYRVNENTVAHTGVGRTNIAFYKGKNDELIHSFVKPMSETFPVQIEDDYKLMLQKKLVVNALINPLTAVLKVNNGRLLENVHYFHIFNELFNEIKEILELEEEQVYYENTLNVCRNTSQNRSSMLKDIEEGRQTEIDAILGYLIEEAEKRNSKAPLVTTLFHIIKGREIERGGK